MAVGCKGAEVTVWNAELQRKVFAGKGSKPNNIGLVDLAWNSAVCFLPGRSGSSQVLPPAYVQDASCCSQSGSISLCNIVTCCSPHW